MSPEQARGKIIDRRADVWAFGVVLYEMLTGRRAFEGEDVSDTLAAVLRQPLDFSALPADTPAPLRTLLERCIEREPKQRLRDIGEARVVLERLAGGRMGAPAVAPARVRAARAPTAAVWSLLALAIVVAAASLFALWAPWRKPTPRAIIRLASPIGADASLETEVGPAAVLSPDGRTIVFRAQKDGVTRLYIRSLDQLRATVMADTEGASSPFFSPDGKWIGFFATRKLKKISPTGGAAVTLCDAPVGRGGTWVNDGTIVFQSSVLSQTPLLRVSPAEGALGVAIGSRRLHLPDPNSFRWLAPPQP